MSDWVTHDCPFGENSLVTKNESRSKRHLLAELNFSLSQLPPRSFTLTAANHKIKAFSSSGAA